VKILGSSGINLAVVLVVFVVDVDFVVDLCVVDLCVVDLCVVDLCVVDLCVVDLCVVDLCVVDLCVVDLFVVDLCIVDLFVVDLFVDILGVVKGVVMTVNTEEGVTNAGSNRVCLVLGKEEKWKKFLKGLNSVGKPPEGLKFEKISPILFGFEFPGIWMFGNVVGVNVGCWFSGLGGGCGC